MKLNAKDEVVGWFGWLFLALFFMALFTRKAYFRGVVERDRDSRKYFVIVFGYLIIAFIGPVTDKIGGFASYPLFSFLTDAATRVAYDIEHAVDQMDRRNANEIEIQHHPLPWPEGCSFDYTLQVSKDSSIVFWCKRADGTIIHSYSTTYHLNYVDVPKTYVVNKASGEPTTLRLLRMGSEKPQVIEVK